MKINIGDVIIITMFVIMTAFVGVFVIAFLF